MATPSQIKKAFRDIVGVSPNMPITGIVKTVESESCSVELKSGLVISDVKLKATINGETNYLKLVPKLGSSVVLIGLTEGLGNMAIIKVDEVEKLEYQQDGLELLVDSTDKKVSIKNDSCSLVEAITDLTTLLKQLKVFTSVGPSGTPLPDTITALEQFETKIKSLLK